MLLIPWTSYGLIRANQLRPDLLGRLEQPFAVQRLMTEFVRHPASRAAARSLFHTLCNQDLLPCSFPRPYPSPRQGDRFMVEAFTRAAEQGRVFLVAAGLPPLRPLLVPAADPGGFAPAPGADRFLAQRALHALDGALMRWRGGNVPAPRGLDDLLDDVPTPPPAAPSVGLHNPRWVHADTAMTTLRPGYALVQDALLLRADAQGLADGSRVVFDLYQGEGRAAQVAKALSGRVTGAVAEVAWTAADLRQQPDDILAMTFRAKAEGAETEPCPVPLRFAFGQCTLDGAPLPGKPFALFDAETGDEVLRGETDDAGLILTPFDYSDRYDVHFSMTMR